MGAFDPPAFSFSGVSCRAPTVESGFRSPPVSGTDTIAGGELNLRRNIEDEPRQTSAKNPENLQYCFGHRQKLSCQNGDLASMPILMIWMMPKNFLSDADHLLGWSFWNKSGERCHVASVGDTDNVFCEMLGNRSTS